MSLSPVLIESIQTVLAHLDEESAQKFVGALSQEADIQRIFDQASFWRTLHEIAPQGSHAEIKPVHDLSSYYRNPRKEMYKAAFGL